MVYDRSESRRDFRLPFNSEALDEFCYKCPTNVPNRGFHAQLNIYDSLSFFSAIVKNTVTNN
jgi:hypothetical protein